MKDLYYCKNCHAVFTDKAFNQGVHVGIEGYNEENDEYEFYQCGDAIPLLSAISELMILSADENTGKLFNEFIGQVELNELKLNNKKCNSGHEDWPLYLWDCPTCAKNRLKEAQQVISAVHIYFQGSKPGPNAEEAKKIVYNYLEKIGQVGIGQEK